MRTLFGVLAAVAMLVMLAPAAIAQDQDPLIPTNLQIVTDYPAVTVQAGDTITFDLDVMAPQPTAVDLEVVDVPEDWAVTLRGGGFVLDGVTASPTSPPSVELEVTVPPNAAPATYRFGVEGRNGSLADALRLAVTVADRPIGGIKLSTEFASLRGKPTDTFRYDLQITNQTPDEITFAFDGTGPDGWNVTAGPASEQRASTVTVAAGDSESVRVEADPPSNTPAGTYDIIVSANGGGQSGTFALTAEVTGTASIELLSENGRLDLTSNAGEELATTVFVVNDGTAALEDVSLRADEPEGWNVTFEPEQIDSVPAGSSQEVTVSVQPAGNAVAGDYALGLTARAGGESSELAYRYTVETSRWWGAIGIAIIVAAFGLLFVVFRQFGRR